MLVLFLGTALTVQGFFLNKNPRQVSSTVLFNKTPLVANGKRVEFEPGTSLLAACQKLGMRVPTDCKKGDCGTCTVTVAGVKIRSCVGKVPPAPRLKSLIEKGLPVTLG